MLQVYSLEEIIAEKLRGILQNIQAFERKGWVRSRARDYYDLWTVYLFYLRSNFRLLLPTEAELERDRAVILSLIYRDLRIKQAHVLYHMRVAVLDRHDDALQDTHHSFF